MRHWFIISSLFLMAGPVLATENQRFVTAGEHKDYSRIVFASGAQNTRIEKKGRTLRLYDIIDPQSLNLSAVNEQRKAHRIISAKIVGDKQSGFIDITMNCNCDIRSVQLANGKYVLDIVDPGHILAEASEVAANKQANAIPAEKPKTTEKASSSDLTKKDILSVEEAHERMVALLQQASIDGLVSIREPNENEQPLGSNTANNHNTSDENTAPDVLAETRLKAGEKSQNLLLPSLKKERPKDDTKLADASAQEVADFLPSGDINYFQCLEDGAFKLLTAVAEKPKEGKTDKKKKKKKKKKNDKHAKEDGLPEESPLIRITELQSELADAELPKSAVLATKLAGEYLAIGFGEEAISVLASYGAEKTLYGDLAHIVAERPLRGDSSLLQAVNCNGAHALWQAAVNEPSDAARLLNQSNNAIKDLPPIIKAMMATRLAAKMIKADEWDTARKYYDIARDTNTYDVPELKFVGAKLLEHDGDFDGAKQLLLQIASENSAAAEDALLALAQAYEDEDTVAHDGFIEDIGALAKTKGDTNSAISEAIAWANIGNIEAAMLLLRNEVKKSPSAIESIKSAARRILLNVLEGDNGLTYISALEALMINDHWLPLEDEKSALINLAARRAAELGLPNLAFEFLSKDNSPSLDLVYAKASTAAAAGDHSKAIEIAAPYTDQVKFSTLVAKSHIENKKYTEAIATATAIADRDQKAKLKAEAAWRARDWVSAVGAFRELDPSTMSEQTAFKFALAAHRAGASNLPGIVGVVLGEKEEAILRGAQELFSTPPSGSVLNRSQLTADGTADEIHLFRELLHNG